MPAEPKKGPGRPPKPPGSCLSCPAPPEPGRARCRACLDREAAYQRSRTEAGLCRCGQSAEPGYRACPGCRAAERVRRAERYAKRKAAGVCATGGCSRKPAAGHVYCKAHLAYLREATHRK